MLDSPRSGGLSKGLVVGLAVAATLCLCLAVYLAQSISPRMAGVGAIALAFAVMLGAKFAHDRRHRRWISLTVGLVACSALTSFMDSSGRGWGIALLTLFAAILGAWALGSEKPTNESQTPH